MVEEKSGEKRPPEPQPLAELAALVEKDGPELGKLVRDLAKDARELSTHLGPTLAKAREGKFATARGLGFLEVKCHTLLQYIMHLVFLVYLKLDGQPLEDHPVVDRLVELRLVLEKPKPMESKFKSQVDKLLKLVMTAETEGEGAAALAKAGMDALQFKPNVHNFAAEEGMAPGDEGGLPNAKSSQPSYRHVSEKPQPSDGIYRPPKVAPVAFEEDTSRAERRKRQDARTAERAAKSRLVRDLAAEFDDAPEEEAADGVGALSGQYDPEVDAVRRRDAYEEDNLVRLTESKKDAKMRRRAGEKRLQDDFKNLNDFSSLASIRAMERQAEGSFDLLRRREKRRQASAIFESEEGSGGEGRAVPEKAHRKRRKKSNRKR
ncbi:MAG: Sas10/Utp3/C1D family-domain-containing protein [Olpidium bornovanus]|uniref:Sas10/Utp3/C1D family-domain-containing protein n=1 Tax=Olpidium bornovanus TaxID=278681 RepID=A0A8H7ZTE9_9FUNG|nr:MAG: Sas10/Utp3/C1D family-domain-containing protein [Olpidium bornovanus]